MSDDGMSDDAIRDLLRRTLRIAVLGASPNPARPSHSVMQFLLSRGFEATPVNPGLAGRLLLGRMAVATLEEAGPLDMVDIFRAPEAAGRATDEAAALGARTVWMQIGIKDQEAAARARAAGLCVVMNRCPKIEWRRLGLDA